MSIFRKYLNNKHTSCLRTVNTPGRDLRLLAPSLGFRWDPNLGEKYIENIVGTLEWWRVASGSGYLLLRSTWSFLKNLSYYQLSEGACSVFLLNEITLEYLETAMKKRWVGNEEFLTGSSSHFPKVPEFNHGAEYLKKKITC